MGIVQLHVQLHSGHFFRQGQGGQVLAHRILIGAHQTAGAQFDAAEPARDHHGDLAHAAMQQHLQHGTPGRAVRLAVVREAHLAAVARRSGHEGPAIVGGVSVFGADLLHEGAGGFQAAAPDDDLGLEGGGGIGRGDGEAAHARPPSPGSGQPSGSWQKCSMRSLAKG